MTTRFNEKHSVGMPVAWLLDSRMRVTRAHEKYLLAKVEYLLNIPQIFSQYSAIQSMSTLRWGFWMGTILVWAEMGGGCPSPFPLKSNEHPSRNVTDFASQMLDLSFIIDIVIGSIFQWEQLKIAPETTRLLKIFSELKRKKKHHLRSRITDLSSWG